MRLLIIAGLILGLSLSTFAQKSPEDEQAFLDVQTDHETFLNALGMNEQDLYDLIQSYMLVRLKKSLDLTDTQTLELMKLVGGYKDQLTRLKFQRGMLMAQLRAEGDNTVGEAVIGATLNRILENEQFTVETMRKLVTESSDTLIPGQQAQLYLFVGDFEQDLRRMATRAKRMDEEGHQHYTQELHDEYEKFGEEQSNAFRKLVDQKTSEIEIQDRDQKNIIELVDAWLVVRLAQELDLSPEEAVMLFTRVGSYKDQLHEMKWLIADARYELRVAAQSADNDSINTQLEDMLLREQAIAELVNVFISESQKNVSVTRSAQLFLFLSEFELEVVDLIERANRMTPAK